MKNSDALKKHHFWILFGLVPLFILIAVVMISSSVGSEITNRNKVIDDEKGKLAKLSNPKSKKVLEYWDENIKTVSSKRGTFWKINWDRQKDLFTWPQSSAFSGFVKVVKTDGKETRVPVQLEDLQFGDPILNNADQFEEFKKPEFYTALFSTSGLTPSQKASLPPGFLGMADMIAPTQFATGWQQTLRYVSDFGQKAITSDQIWLMMEDVWVQRSLLQAIKSVNDEMGEFRRIKYEDKGGRVIDDPTSPTGPNEPLRRKFRSRVWEVAIEVGTHGNRQYLTGTLENITERLQVLGVGKTMTLKVWLDGKRDQDGKLVMTASGQPDVQGIEPIEFYIGSEFLPGKGGEKTIKDKDGKEIKVPANVVSVHPDESSEKDFEKYRNIVPAGKNVVEIVKVEQVFDTQTVPVRRIDAMELGKTDSRYAARALKGPLRFFKTPEAPAGTDSGTGNFAGGGSVNSGGSRKPGGGPTAGGSGFDPRSGGGGSGDGKAGGGALATVIDGNKLRYVEITERVRRMPVGIVVVVDQSNIQDVLLAFANSPLRFQITQVTWNRFRGTISGGAGDLTSGSSGSIMGLPGQIGGGLSGEGDPDSPYRRGGMSSPTGGTRPFGGSSLRPPSGSSGSPPGPRSGGGGVAPEPTGFAPPAAGGTGGYSAGGMSGFGPFGGEGSLSTAVSEAQLTSGLVELGIYGIVSLYEKYNPAEDTEAATTSAEAKEPKAPADKDSSESQPKDKEPKDKDTKDPMPAGPTSPKQRRRRPA